MKLLIKKYRFTAFLFIMSAKVFVYCGEYAASFLDIGLGARGLAMGGAFCSLVDDGTAFFWNPAGLGYVSKTSIAGMYGPQFGTIKEPLAQYHFVGISQPLIGNAVIGVNWVRFSADDIPVFSELQGDSYWDRFHDPSLRPSGDPEGYIRDVEDALFFTFARINRFTIDMSWGYYRFHVEIPIGINIKWIHQSLGDGEASGLGLDAGMMIRVRFEEALEEAKFGTFAFGLHLQDLTNTKLSWNTRHQDALPTNVRWGVSYSQPLPFGKHQVSLSYGKDTRWNGREHIGIEYTLLDRFALRAGLDDGAFTGGAGISFWKIHVDYAFLSHELDSLHRLSCSLTF